MAMTREQLREQVNLAYDRYIDGIEALGDEYDIMPPSVRNVEADERTAAAAAVLWQTFKTEQDKLNDEYAQPTEDKAAAREERQRRETAVRTAEGQVKAAEITLSEKQQAAAAAEKAGVEPDTQAVADAETALAAAKANLATVEAENQ